MHNKNKRKSKEPSGNVYRGVAHHLIESSSKALKELLDEQLFNQKKQNDHTKVLANEATVASSELPVALDPTKYSSKLIMLSAELHDKEEVSQKQAAKFLKKIKKANKAYKKVQEMFNV